MSAKELAQAAKAKGNAAFSAGKYDEAVQHFSEAITHDPTDAIFYSNRSGAYASLNQSQAALDDADKCIELNPAFVKGYSRKGHALHSLQKYSEAKEAYEAGLKVDANNAALKEGLEEATRALSSPPPSSNPFGAMFGPDMWGKLMADPVTKGHLSDPAFLQKMNELQRNPQLFGQYARDPKVGQALGVLMGLPADVFGGMGGKGGMGGVGGMGDMGGEGASFEMEDGDEDDEGAEEVHAGSSRPAYQPPPREQKQEHKAPPPKVERELTEEEKSKREAEKEKEAGNKLFTAKKFDEAITHYQRAAELDPTNIVYLNNTAACHFEKKDYAACIATSLKSVETGREHMSNYKDVAKAWLRVGNAYTAEKKWTEAIDAYEKSMMEDVNDKAKMALKKAQEQKRKQEDAEYINPELSEQEKQKGNELFKEGIDAIGHYTEALKRDPSNYKVYSNRAACYAKLMDWERGLADCEACLKRDSSFVKAYIRKGKIHHFLKQYHKALEAFEKGLALEPDSTELKEERMRTMMAINTGEADPARAQEAMKDPEIQAILRDPTINKVLQDLQQNPSAGQAAMRDKDIRSKIEKLIAAGVLSTK